LALWKHRPAEGRIRYTKFNPRMTAKSPRIHTVLEPYLYEAVEILARKHGRSLSQEVRELVCEALEVLEDHLLDGFSQSRRKTFQSGKALTIREARKRLRSAKRGK